MEKAPGKARCVNCRTDVEVPASYAHGDHIKCGSCNTQHRVLRGDVLRLVIADVEPLKQVLRESQRHIETLEAELRDARASLGIGANGIGVAVAWAIYQVGFKDAALSMPLLWHAVGIALGTGIVLEVANYLFLAKRQKITRLSAEIATLRAEGRQLQQKIRDASRV